MSEIHDRIGSFLNGSVDNLGDSLSELLGSDESADDEGEDTEMNDEAAEKSGSVAAA